jgi:membrane protein YqaA with SNARE-associated domain
LVCGNCEFRDCFLVVTRTLSRWIVGLFATPIGVVVLAALDSTVFFSLPFGIDAAVIILAARERALAWSVPLLATAGSVAGAALSFWMGGKIGEKGLEHYVQPRRLNYIRRRVRNTGAIALAVLDLIPPPFPFTPFVVAAGALEVDTATFFVTLTLCRIVRFGAEALLAVFYGPRILGWLESNTFHNLVAACIVFAVVGSAVSIVRLARASRSKRRRAAA